MANTSTQSHEEIGKKSSMGGKGGSEKASPAAIERYLKGAHYPASKDELIECAKGNHAPEDILAVLNRFQSKEYKATTDVAKETGQANQSQSIGSGESRESQAHQSKGSQSGESKGGQAQHAQGSQPHQSKNR